MTRKKPSFFDRLTGTINIEEDSFDDFDVYEDEAEDEAVYPSRGDQSSRSLDPYLDEEEREGELAVEMYQTTDDIILKAMVAGVRPEDLDISINREMVTIRGRREGAQNVDPQDYFFRELHWGPFSRTINLPFEIEVEEAEAIEKHGLLIIRLPKVNKERETKLKVKSQ